MRVGDEHVAAMRASLVWDRAEENRLDDGFTRADRWCSGALFAATLFVLTERRFTDPDTARADVAAFVSNLRARAPEIAELVDQDSAERILLACVVALDIDDIDDDTQHRHYPFLLAGLNYEAQLDDAAIDVVLADARRFADSMLADVSDPEPDPEDLGLRIGRRQIAAVRAFMRGDAVEYNRLHRRPLAEPELAVAALISAALILTARKRFANSDTARGEIAEFVRGIDRLLPPLDKIDGIDQIPDLAGVEITFDPQIAEQVLLEMIDSDYEAELLGRTAGRIHTGLVLIALINETQPSSDELDTLLTEAQELVDSIFGEMIKLP